jgi:hypothetical protein
MSCVGDTFRRGLGAPLCGAIFLALGLLACGTEHVAPAGPAAAGQPPVAGHSGAPGGNGSAAGGMAAAGAGGAGGQAGATPQGGVGAGAGGDAAGGSSTAGAAGAAPDRSKRKMLLRDEGNSALHYVDLETPAKSWHQPVPVGRDLQVIGGGLLLIGTEDGYEERKLADGSLVKSVDDYPGAVSAHRLHSGNTLLSGVAFHGGSGINLVEVTPQGAVARTISYPGDYVRLIRESQGGHFLVTAENRVFEGDADGNVLWQVTLQGHAMPHAWEALRLASGDVLVAGGYAASLQIFGADEMLKQTITGGDGAMPFFFADVQVMPGGSYVVANWQGHGVGFGGSGLQVLEYDSAGKLIWYWKQDASFVSSLQHLIVLDGLDLEKLQVESRETGMLEAVN